LGSCLLDSVSLAGRLLLFAKNSEELATISEVILIVSKYFAAYF
jgi:hypothetical protein